MTFRAGRGLAAAMVVLAAGCGSPDSTSSSRTAASDPQSVTSGPSTGGSPGSSAGETRDGLRIQLVIDGARLTATLLDTAASRDLVAQLPLTLTMSDHGSVEKTGELPARLSTAGAPRGADPSIGDIGYYAPWNNLVLYYGDQGYYDGIVRLGTLDGGVDEIARQPGDVTVTIQRLESSG